MFGYLGERGYTGQLNETLEKQFQKYNFLNHWFMCLLSFTTAYLMFSDGLRQPQQGAGGEMEAKVSRRSKGEGRGHHGEGHHGEGDHEAGHQNGGGHHGHHGGGHHGHDRDHHRGGHGKDEGRREGHGTGRRKSRKEEDGKESKKKHRGEDEERKKGRKGILKKGEEHICH